MPGRRSQAGELPLAGFLTQAQCLLRVDIPPGLELWQFVQLYTITHVAYVTDDIHHMPLDLRHPSTRAQDDMYCLLALSFCL